MKDVSKVAQKALKAGELLVIGESVGNPDHGQYAPVSNDDVAIVNSLEQGVGFCLAYICTWNLGGGNWSGGQIYDHTGKMVAYVSYNGRAWEKEPKFKCESTEVPIDQAKARSFVGTYVRKLNDTITSNYLSN